MIKGFGLCFRLISANLSSEGGDCGGDNGAWLCSFGFVFLRGVRGECFDGVKGVGVR